MAHLTERLRAEFHGKPLKFTVIYPGYIASETNQKAAQGTPMMASTEKGVRSIVAAIEKERTTCSCRSCRGSR